MHDWLRAAAVDAPERSYLITEDGALTFNAVDTRADQIASALAAVGRPHRVGIWVDNSPDVVAAFFGVWRVRATGVLLNRRLAIAEAADQVVEAGVDLVVGEDPPDLGVARARLADLATPGRVERENDPAAIAWMVATSGSSGRPKWVRLTFGNLEASAAGSAIAIDHRPDDVWLANLPLFHVGGAMIPIRCARQGSALILEERFDPQRSAGLLASGEASLASMVATTLSATLDASEETFYRTKAVLVGGGPVDPGLTERAIRRGMPVRLTYGMTETCSQVATEIAPGSGMTVIEGAEIRVIEGRILVRGAMVSPGWDDDPDRGPDDWFDTGDVGEIDALGRLTVLGRSDLVMISGGENVSPEEVEAAIRSHPEIDDAVVVGIPDPVWGSVVGAAYVGTVAPGEVERHVRYRLAGYKVPKRWVHVEALPRTPLGKPDRGAVVGLFSV